MPRNSPISQFLCRFGALLILALALLGCEDQLVVSVPGGGGGGDGPNPDDPDPLVIETVRPNPSAPDRAATNTSFFIEFDRAAVASSVDANIELRFINEELGTAELVPLVRNTTFDALLPDDQHVVIYDLADGELVGNTSTTAENQAGQKRFYQLSILPGVTATDGGMLESVFVREFGTRPAADETPNFPNTIEVNAVNPFDVDLYSMETQFDLFISSLIDGGTGTFPLLLSVNINDGSGQPGDIVTVYTPGGNFNDFVFFESPLSAPAESEFTVTLTAWDNSLNFQSMDFPFTWDTLPPDAPTGITRSDMAGGPISSGTLDVDVDLSAPPSPTGAFEIEVRGGQSPALVTAISDPNPNISVSLRMNQTNTLTAVAIDAAGNVSDPSDELQVVHDNLPPQMSVEWIPTLVKNATTEINQTSVTLRSTITSSEVAQIEVFSSHDMMMTPLASQVVGGPVTANLNVDLSAIAALMDPEATLTVVASDFDQPENTIDFTPYTVRVDVSVDPEPTITRICDAMGPCLADGVPMGECAVGGGMMARSPTCLRYDTGSPGGWRMRQQTVNVYGTVEAGASLRFLPPGSIFVNGTADESSDVFPVDGTDGPDIRVSSDGGRFDITATDGAGNEATTVGDAQIVSDTVAPEPPTYNTAASTGMSCTVSVDLSDPVFDAVIMLEGPFSGDCDGLDIDFDLVDGMDNPSPTLGEQLRARVMAGSTFESSGAAPATYPMSITESVTGVTLPASFEDAISEFSATSVDALGNESAAARLAVVHRTDANTVIAPVIENLINNGGDHDTESLDFSVTGGMPDIVATRPTNATSLTIEGRTDPDADGVELLDDMQSALAPPVTAGVNSSTGAFTLTVPISAYTTNTVNTFYVESTRTIMAVPQTERVQLDLDHDTAGPTQTPSRAAGEVLSSPQGGTSGELSVRVDQTLDPSGNEEVELVARRFTDSACTMASDVDPIYLCSVTGPTNEACAPLAAAGTSSLALNADTGDYIEVLFRDEAGNESTMGSRLCAEVTSSRRLATLVDGSLDDESGLNIFNIDDATPMGLLLPGVGNTLIPDPSQLYVYSPTRMFILNRSDGTSSLVHYDLTTDTLESMPPELAQSLGQMVIRSDRQIAAFLQAGILSDSSIVVAQIDGSENITELAGSSITFPGSQGSNKIPINLALFPVTVDPQQDWALVVRAGLELFGPAQIPEGDALIFDLQSGNTIVPDGGFVSNSTLGITIGPAPTDLLITNDGYYALVANATSTTEDPPDTDLTVLDFSACTAAMSANCTQANFIATQLSIQSAGPTEVNGIAAIAFIPGDNNRVLAVEEFIPDAGDGTADAKIHLLQIDWATPSVMIEASLHFEDKIFAPAISISDDGSEAFLLNENLQEIQRVEVDTGTPALSAGGTLSPNPGTSQFRTTFSLLP